MAIVDMPLEQLLEYKGKNPCPTDFDQFWERSLVQMRNIDPQIEIVPSTFLVPNVLCFDLYFTGIDGARIHTKLLRPKKIKDKSPAIVQFHGYKCNCGDWMSKVALASNGFVVAAMDCRGQGGTSEDSGQDSDPIRGCTVNGQIIRGIDDKPENFTFRKIFLDAAQLAGIVMDMDIVDETRVATMGASQGGALALVCAALEPRVCKAVASFPFLSDYQRVWEMDFGTEAYGELKYYFRFKDPNHLREKEIFTKLGYIDIQHMMKWIKADVLFFTGLRDDICPPSSQFAAYNKIVSKKELSVYPDFGHEMLPYADDNTFRFLYSLLS